MNVVSLVKVNDEAKKALQAFDEAVGDYKYRTKRHIYAGPIDLGKPIPRPQALLSFAALNEIERAWRKLEQADAALRQVYARLAVEHDNYFKDSGET